MPAHVGESALWVRSCRVRWILSGEVILILVFVDFREFKATLEDQEINVEPFSNGLKYSIAGAEDEVIASADQYKLFCEKLVMLGDSRSSIIDLRPVMESIVCKIRWDPTA